MRPSPLSKRHGGCACGDWQPRRHQIISGDLRAGNDFQNQSAHKVGFPKGNQVASRPQHSNELECCAVVEETMPTVSGLPRNPAGVGPRSFPFAVKRRRSGFSTLCKE
jgi:hypothetical protein